MTDRFTGLRTGLAEFGSYLFNTFKVFISWELGKLGQMGHIGQVRNKS